MLYGMAEPVHAAVKRLGLRLRVYAPVGELVPGHGLPGAPPAREHVQRELRAPPLRRGPRPRRAPRAARGRRDPRAHRRARRSRPPTPTTRRRTSPSRCASGGGRQRAPRSPSPIDQAGDAATASTCPRSSTASRSRTAATHRLGRPRRRSTGRRHVGVVHGGRRRRARSPPPSRPRRRGGDAGRRAGRRCCSAPPTGCASGATSSPPSSASRRASRGTRPTPTCARPSTSASTTAARCSASTRRAADLVQSPPGEANRLDVPGQGRHRGHRAVELPARHPVRHDRRRARPPATR